MQKVKRSIAIALSILCFATPCLAENTMKTVFEDAFYGGLTGGLVGAAVLIFTKHPGSHLDYMGYGAAGGVLVGAGYGAIVASRSLAEVENGKIKFAMPSITPELKEAPKGQTSFVAKAELIRGKF